MVSLKLIQSITFSCLCGAAVHLLEVCMAVDHVGFLVRLLVEQHGGEHAVVAARYGPLAAAALGRRVLLWVEDPVLLGLDRLHLRASDRRDLI